MADIAFLKEKEEELRKEYPQMFEHSELQPGEVWLGDKLSDVITANIGSYKSAGVLSARKGNPVSKPFRDKGNWTFYPMFVNLHEFIEADEKHKQGKSTA